MFTDLSDVEQSKVRDVITRLLDVNFLVKEKERDVYSTIRRHRAALEAYFKFLGWDLTIDERHECVYLHVSEGKLRRRLDREQTVWLLALRLLYEEKRQGLSLSEYPMVTLYEIRSKYETFRLDFVNRTTLDKLIRLAAQFQLIEPMDTDNRSDDARFTLFHTWMYVVQIDEMNEFIERLQQYDTNGEGGETDEVDDEAAIDQLALFY
jgi:hypothetical protein